MLTRDDILGADDLPREIIETPEWGGDVYVRMLSAAEMEAYLAWQDAASDDDKRTAEAQIVARCVCDEAGSLLFTLEDVTGLRAKNPDVVRRVATVALTVNGATREAVEELEGNSDGDPSADSSSD